MIKQYCTHWKYEQRILQREPIIYTGQVYFHGQIEEGGWGFIGMLCAFKILLDTKLKTHASNRQKEVIPMIPPYPLVKANLILIFVHDNKKNIALSIVPFLTLQCKHFLLKMGFFFSIFFFLNSEMNLN